MSENTKTSGDMSWKDNERPADCARSSASRQPHLPWFLHGMAGIGLAMPVFCWIGLLAICFRGVCSRDDRMLAVSLLIFSGLWLAAWALSLKFAEAQGKREFLKMKEFIGMTRDITLKAVEHGMLVVHEPKAVFPLREIQRHRTRRNHPMEVIQP